MGATLLSKRAGTDIGRLQRTGSRPGQHVRASVAVGGDASGGWGMVEAVAIERSGAAEPAASAPSTRVFGRILYKAGGGRATTFSFIFLLLLPFFVSLGPMLAMRISHGLWDGTLGLAILAAAFAVLM